MKHELNFVLNIARYQLEEKLGKFSHVFATQKHPQK